MEPTSWASSPAVRKSMLGNRSRDTSPELRLRRLLWAQGLRYRVCRHPTKSIRRRIDIVFGPAKVAVEVRGCFWHGCERHYRQPATNVDFWVAKINRNRERDAETEQLLRDAGWLLVVVWEHEDPGEAAGQVAALVRDRRRARGARGR